MQRKFGINAGPGEVLSEAFQGLRNRRARGEISLEEAQRLSEAPDIPWDTGSTQISALMVEAGRIKQSKAA